MKKLSAPALLLALVLCAQCALCQSVFDYEDAVVTVEGGQVTVALEGNETTGFVWEASSGDEVVLSLLSGDYVPDANPDELVGVGGRSVFTFSAGQPGSTVIDMNYLRPWEGVADRSRCMLFDVSEDAQVIGVCLQGDEVLIIRLPENPSTGFVWTFSANSETVYTYLLDDYIPDQADEALLCAGGTRAFAFRAGVRGDMRATFALARGEEIARTVEYLLSVDYDEEYIEADDE